MAVNGVCEDGCGDLEDIEEMLSLNVNYVYENSRCFTCGGFYGPCFGEPLCATCHTFLFPQDWCNPRTCTLLNSVPIGDDNDSGNDEPSDPSYPVSANPSPASAPPPDDPVEPDPPDPACPPDICYRLSLLTIPQPDIIPSSLLPIQALPPEILLLIFSFLDDLSLWSVSEACHQWRRLILAHFPQDLWQQAISTRFPLFKPVFQVRDWFFLYSRLIKSSSCYTCLNQGASINANPDQENWWRRNRLIQEVRSIRNDPPAGIAAMPLDSDCCFWQATISGPVGSPYEGGLFYLYLQVPYSYPMDPPLVRFITRIFHPNISRHGDVGIDSIYHNWSLALTITKILVSIQSLLTDPYCQVCMEPSVGRLYSTNREVYLSIARAWTWRYAMSELPT